jgi:hypothetical protein
MFQSSAHRLRAWLSRAEDILGDAPVAAHDRYDALLRSLEDDPLPHPRDRPLEHPHRRALRWQRTRRAGAIAPRPAHCLCPVRATGDAAGRDRAAH